MTTWALDLQARIGQRVLPTYVIDNALDTRFRVVHADTLREALDIGRFQANAINKLQCVLVGGEAVFSDQELDWLIDNDHYPLDVVSIPNPTRCGILDAYLVGKKEAPTIAIWRQQNLSERVLALP
jgi:hypothetical protein